MAGEWWAERLNDEYADKRPALAKAVAARVAQELRGECYWDWWGERKEGRGREDCAQIEFDYDPHYLLGDAIAEAMPDLPGWKARATFPPKRHMLVYADRLEPKDGYGNWTPEIPVELDTH